jgi:hypothetical protein
MALIEKRFDEVWKGHTFKEHPESRTIWTKVDRRTAVTNRGRKCIVSYPGKLVWVESARPSTGSAAIGAG